jgi:hypothetical protein
MAVNVSYTVSYANRSLAYTRANTLDTAVIGGGLREQLVAQGLTELTGVTQAVASSIVAPVTPPEARYTVHMTTTLYGYSNLTFGINEQDAFVEAIAILGECETTDVQVVRVVDSSAQLNTVGTWELHTQCAVPSSKSLTDEIVYRNVNI